MAYWGDRPEWRGLDSRSKAAAMALLEADQKGGKIDLDSARNALGAMINRAARDKVDIGEHVSGKIYQPTIEDAQFARLAKIVGSPEHQALMKAYDDRVSGRAPDWVQGATHFLAPESTMLSLEASDPQKYKSWRQWTKFDPAKGEYQGVMLRDGSHAFLAPEGAYSAKFDGSDTATAAPVQVAASQPSGGLLNLASLGSTEKPASGGGLLDGLFSGGDTFKPMLGQLAALDSPRSGPAPEEKRPDPLDGGDAAEGVQIPQMKRQQTDLRRVLAVLQSRSRLGTV